MKDNLRDLFQERFQGHEAPVDPATWQVIEARMLTSAPATDSVNELFRERFQQHEMSVDPGVWQGINTQLGHGAAAGGGFLGGFGWVAAGVGGLVVAGGLIIALNGNDPSEQLAKQEPRREAFVVPVEAAPATPSEQFTINTADSPTVRVARPIINAQPARSAPNTPSTTPQALHIQEYSVDDPVTAQPSEATPVDAEPEGVEIVNSIIADMTRHVEVATTTPQPPPSSNGAADTGASPSDASRMMPDATQEVSKPCRLFLQNTFTPNNDGINDAYVVAAEECIIGARIRIFSMKNNQLVFSADNYEPWTGANCEDGWYMVAVEATTVEGAMISEGKVVWLNRTGMN